MRESVGVGLPGRGCRLGLRHLKGGLLLEEEEGAAGVGMSGVAQLMDPGPWFRMSHLTSLCGISPWKSTNWMAATETGSYWILLTLGAGKLKVQ